MTARHWAGTEEAGAKLGMRILLFVHRWLGRAAFRIALAPVILYYVATRPAARRASREYLTRLHRHRGVFTRPPGFFATVAHFTAFAETMLDKLLSWSGRFAEPVRFEGTERLLALVGQRRGALIITAHLGNLELCRALSTLRAGLTLNALSYTRHATKFHAVMSEANPASTLNMLEVSDLSPATAMLLADKVARGEFVVITGDRIPAADAPRVTQAPFLGAPAPLPVGPWVLANALRCPVFLLFSARLDDGYHIFVEPFRDVVELSRQGREAQIAALAGDFARRLEHYCARAPLQWFNFYPFWTLPGNAHDARQ